jgi:hypothetical protein
VEVYGLLDVENSTLSRPVVPNLWYAYPGGTRWTGWWYTKVILVIAKNKKKGVEIKIQKQSYEVLVYKERIM